MLPVLFLALSGCKKDRRLQSEKDDEIIKQYVADNGLNAIRTESGLYVVVTEEGTGGNCISSSNVKVNYKGYYTSGTVFDEAENASFALPNTIAGWQEGIPYFNEGGYGKLIVPSRLAYKDNGSGSIPPNTVLVFDIKLLDVF